MFLFILVINIYIDLILFNFGNLFIFSMFDFLTFCGLYFLALGNLCENIDTIV
jgi:hypothetical protein